MKQTALFVNISRGKTADEKSLIRQLQEGWIKGAGLMCMSKNRLGDHPFKEMDNVTLALHIVPGY